METSQDATDSSSKRKRDLDPDPGDDDKPNQLLNQNPFALLAKALAGQGQPNGPIVTQPEIASGKKKQPPLVVKNVSFATLSETVPVCGVRPVYKITRFGTKIICNSAEDFSAVQTHLETCGYEYYTHDKPTERPYRVVLRGLPLVNPAELQSRLKAECGLDAQAVHIIKRKGECAALDESFYLVHFAKGYTNLKKLSEVKHIARIIVRWEAYRNKRADVTQCMNCLYHGHGTRNCHLKSRCNNCGGTHATEKCPTKNAPAKRCANCDGAHLATDRSCPKRAEYIRIRQQATTSKQPGRKAGAATPAPAKKDFPPLPNSSVPAAASNLGGSQSADNAGSKQHKYERHIDPRNRAGMNVPPANSSPEENEEMLYSSAELWTIFTEFSQRLKQCKTKTAQVEVIGYMVCKYGVN